jgi:hypothetical protein
LYKSQEDVVSTLWEMYKWVSSTTTVTLEDLECFPDVFLCPRVSESARAGAYLMGEPTSIIDKSNL